MKAFYLLSRLLRLPAMSPKPYDERACHTDELMYLFSMTPILDMLPSEQDQEVRRAMVSMWSQFASTGQPHPGPWIPAHTAQDDQYFVIGANMKMMAIPEVARFKHWEQTK